MGKFSVSTLDFPGANSPAPGMPLNSSPADFMNYLSDKGINFIVAQSPLSADSVYYSIAAQKLATSDFYNYRATGTAIEKWNALLSKILKTGEFRTKFFGAYVVIQTDKLLLPQKAGVDTSSIQMFGAS